MVGQPGRVWVFFVSADSGLGDQIVSLIRQADPALTVEARPWRVEQEPPGQEFSEGDGYALFLATESAMGPLGPGANPGTFPARGLLPLLLRVGSCVLPPWSQSALLLNSPDSVQRFFEKERQVIPSLDSTKRSGQALSRPLRDATRRELRLVACHCLDEPAFLAFTFDAGLPPLDFGGGSLEVQVLHLLHVLDTPDRLDHFADWLELERAPCVQKKLASLREGEIAFTPMPPGEARSAVRSIYISFHPSDARWLGRLRAQLKPLEREGWVTCWDMTQIPLGAEREPTLRRAMDRARIAVLLISAKYLADDLIATQQLPRLLAAAQAGGMVVTPVLLSPCDLPVSLASYQPLACRATLSQLSRAESDSALTELVRAIRRRLTTPGELHQPFPYKT